MIDEAYVREALKLSELEVEKASLPAVLANLERIAGFAGMLEAIPLNVDDEPAPVWRP